MENKNVNAINKIIAINNIKYAWQFILENDFVDYDFKLLCYLLIKEC